MKPRFVALFVVLAFSVAPCGASAMTRDIMFPVAGTSTFSDDFHDPRGGGTRVHLGNDIMAEKWTPVVAATDGTIVYLVSPEASWGYAITLEDADGYQYRYLHINNDDPGTDDGVGGEEHAYAPGIAVGKNVKRGDVLGWVGDSGNAENVGAHLHFELREPDDHIAIDPYDSLLDAWKRGVSTATAPFATSTSPALRAVRPIVHASPKIGKRLAYGMKGKEVLILQEKLIELGYLHDAHATGYYGTLTKKAVLGFQKQHHLEQVGYVGAKTRALLNKS